MERIQDRRPEGISRQTLRLWGLLFLAADTLSRGLEGTLGDVMQSPQQLLDALNNSATMWLVTVALVLRAVGTCAVPIFALLLTEGMTHTSNRKRYLLRVALLALACEIPYDLMTGNGVVNGSAQNPVMGCAFAMLMLLLMGCFPEKTGNHRLSRIVTLIAALLWCSMLNIQYGGAMVLLTGVLWLMKNKPQFRGLAGAGAAMVCGGFSPFFLASPMGFLPIHFYNGEKGEDERYISYLAYPGMLLVVWLAVQIW